MEKALLVSIIIPCYNRAELIKETLDSVVAQTYKNWECIVVDDHSTDDTWITVKGYQANDKRFKLFVRPDNHKAGGNGARNYGFKKSSGSFINWFDSDDIMYPEFIQEKLECFLSNPKAHVVFSAYESAKLRSNKTIVSNSFFSGDILEDLVDDTVTFQPLAFMIRRIAAKNIRFDETLKKNQDLDFFFRLFTSDDRIRIVHSKKILHRVRSHKGSMWFNMGRDIDKMQSVFKVYSNVLDYFVKINHKKGINKYKRKSLGSLMMMMKYGFYFEVINKLLRFKHLDFINRFYLLGCTFMFFLTKKGAYRFVDKV
ncbi:MAG: glycosyltransferase family 2 protein [Bacteroidota bacterium]